VTSADSGRAPAGGATPEPSGLAPSADRPPTGAEPDSEVTAGHGDPKDPVEPEDPGTSENEAHEDDEEPKHKSFWRELPVLVLVALVLAFLIKTFLVQAFFIPSESMENTLLVGDRVLVNKLAYRFGEVQRGDVVVFDGRGTFEPRRPTQDDGTSIGDAIRAIASSFGLAPGTESDYIKRVIGVGGDHVVCCDSEGRITVNDTPLSPEDYLFPGDEPSNTSFDITVPDGRIWVMGDHRSRSEDSRAHTGSPGGGTVAVDRVIGRAFVKVWPINRWDTMPRPEAFDDIADPVALSRD
jgi:signal peptidase I